MKKFLQNSELPRYCKNWWHPFFIANAWLCAKSRVLILKQPKNLENLRTCKRSDAVLLVDVPQLELAVCGGRDDVGRVEELDVGNGFPVSLENVRSGTIPIFFCYLFVQNR